MATENDAIVCSAPGKVLITGGYLVLESPNGGLTCAVTARFYTTLSTTSSEKNDKDSLQLKINVETPQVTDEVLSYELAHAKCENNSSDSVQLHALNEAAKSNVFVTCAVRFGLKMVHAFLCRSESGLAKLTSVGSLALRVVGSNAFYSQRANLQARELPASVEGLRALPEFLAAARDEHGALHKTGLGSSAALTTSIVGALAGGFGVGELGDGALGDDARHAIHAAAQLAHCVAQGKIGSGFDVSAAVYGSQCYVRFGADLLAEFMDDALGDVCAARMLALCATIAWGNERSPFALPPNMRLVLGDVSCGSNTPSMVRKVLAAKRDRAEEFVPLWQELGERNKHVRRFFERIARASHDGLLRCSTLDYGEWPTQLAVVNYMRMLRDTFDRIRYLLRAIGTIADVPIEPPEQTALIDATLAVPGVLIAGVPGAGGFDAIFAVLFGDHEAALRRVEALWSSWKAMDVLPLVVETDLNGLVIEKSSGH
jgi:phosphomevalonate kinase